MIPVKLTIQGLYSYRQRQTIEFDNLTSAKLFGLFGGVGSGKSTILEAISFALYGESERLNRNDNRNYNMMNLKSNELLIDFEFVTGLGDRYRFAVSGRRNGKRFDEVKSFERAAYKWDTSQWLPLPDASAEKVTGLSYDNFRRTIIIPQGKFQEFLQLSPKERTSMLMELFGLEKFELSGKVNGLELRNNGQMQHLNGQLAVLGHIEPSQLELLRTHLTLLATELKALGDQIAQNQKEVQTFEKHKELQTKHIAQQQRVADLEKQHDEMTTLERTLREYEQVVLTFQSDLELMSTLSAKKHDAENQLKADAEKLATDTVAHHELKATFDELKTAFDKKEQLLKLADEWGKVAQIQGFETKRKELATRSENGTKLLAEKTEGLVDLKTEAKQLKETIEKTRQAMPDMAVLAEVKQWFAHQTNFDKSQADLQQRIDRHRTAMSALQNDALGLAKTLRPDVGEGISISESIHWIEAQKEDAKARQNLLAKKKTHAEVSLRLQTFASELTEGEPCPLCGSAHHPQVYSASHANDEMAQLDAQLSQTEKQLTTLDEARSKLAQFGTLSESTQKQLAEDLKQAAQMKAQATEHVSKFVWAAYSPTNPKLADDHFAKAQEISKQLEQQAKQLDEQTKRIEKEEADKEKYAKALEQIERERLSLTTQIEMLTAQLAMLSPADYEALPLNDIAPKGLALRKQHDDLAARYQAADKQLQTLTLAIQQLNGKMEANQKSLAQLAQELETLTVRVNQKLADAQLPSLQHVETVLQQKPDVAAGRQRIERWRNDTAAARELLATLRLELQGHSYDEAAHKQALIQLADATDKANQLNQSIGDTTNQLKRLETDLAKQAQLNAELEKLQLRAANLAELKNMFRSSGFVNYVSTVYLHNLCAAANERFYRLTRQHLSLELADDNSFQVRDFMNEGKVRSVKTLSGGQTFQASLSLALALADSVRHLSAGDENFFFLDEGFGTLDRESLATVFDTLKSLRHENRIVGVISHVDEMQQEIQTYLRVTNSEELGSVVKGSWEV